MNPMSSENGRAGNGRPATECAGSRDNEGGGRGRFVCGRRLLSRAELRERGGGRRAAAWQSSTISAVWSPWKRQRPFGTHGEAMGGSHLMPQHGP
jgi:hypothetical protein